MNNEHGTVRISDEAIASCAAKAALDTEGVYGFSSGLSDAIAENILRKTSDTKGIKVGYEGESIVLDLNIVVNYGVRIPSVAWNIQENVKKNIEEFTGCNVEYININVQGIHFE